MADGGAVENALRVAKLRLNKYDGGSVEGEVSFAPEEKPDYEKASDFVQQQLNTGEPQLPQMDREAYNKWKYGAVDALHGMAYLDPLTAPAIGAYDFLHGAATGNPKEMAGSMFGLPSKVAKAIATAAFAEQPESEGASPASKIMSVAKDRMAKGGMIEKALQLASGGGAWTRKEGKNMVSGGLNAKGRASLKAQGHDIKPPAPHPKTEKDAGRRKSFCARMSGMQGPMKDEKGRPTRKALSLKAWNC
jgi:hypothetical protein